MSKRPASRSFVVGSNSAPAPFLGPAGSSSAPNAKVRVSLSATKKKASIPKGAKPFSGLVCVLFAGTESLCGQDNATPRASPTGLYMLLPSNDESAASEPATDEDPHPDAKDPFFFKRHIEGTILGRNAHRLFESFSNSFREDLKEHGRAFIWVDGMVLTPKDPTYKPAIGGRFQQYTMLLGDAALGLVEPKALFWRDEPTADELEESGFTNIGNEVTQLTPTEMIAMGVDRIACSCIVHFVRHIIRPTTEKPNESKSKLFVAAAADGTEIRVNLQGLRAEALVRNLATNPDGLSAILFWAILEHNAGNGEVPFLLSSTYNTKILTDDYMPEAAQAVAAAGLAIYKEKKDSAAKEQAPAEKTREAANSAGLSPSNPIVTSDSDDELAPAAPVPLPAKKAKASVHQADEDDKEASKKAKPAGEHPPVLGAFRGVCRPYSNATVYPPMVCWIVKCSAPGCEDTVCVEHGNGYAQDQYIDYTGPPRTDVSDMLYDVARCIEEGCNRFFCDDHVNEHLRWRCQNCQQEQDYLTNPSIGVFYNVPTAFLCGEHKPERCTKVVVDDGTAVSEGHPIDEDKIGQVCGFRCCRTCMHEHYCGEMDPNDYL
eukprot:tig00000189_g14308.t1